MRLGRYEIVRKIATGGMADVFLALQWGDGGFVREVVLKRLHAHHTGDKTLVEDFRNEADLLARLRYPGIPQVLEFRCSERGEWYLAMEYVRGPTVRDLLSRAPERLPLPVALALGCQLSRLLDQVHSAVDPLSGTEIGVVHGDITPTNVIADAAGGVHLLDFGIAGGELHRQARRSEGIRGTAGFFPPEAVGGGPLPDRRADVFSLGALLYEVFVGVRPFDKDSVRYVNQIVVGPKARPRDIDASMASGLEEVLMACLAPKPEHRPATTMEVAAALTRVAASQQLTASPRQLGEYVDSYFPANEEAATRVGQPNRGFVVSIPDEDDDALSSAERDELLADLDLFAPEGSLTPEERESLVPEFEEPLIDDSAFESAPPPSAPAVPPPPPPPRAMRQEKQTPVAFPTPADLASLRPGEGDEAEEVAPIEDAPLPAPRTGPRPRRPRPAQESAPRARTTAPPPDSDSGGFYLYVADEDG
ncbi:MAG: serine/threonine-protein kinase [Myxococcota bacterium]